MDTIKGASTVREKSVALLSSLPSSLRIFNRVYLGGTTSPPQPPFSFFVFRFAVDYSGVLEYSTSSYYLPSLEPHSIS